MLDLRGITMAQRREITEALSTFLHEEMLKRGLTKQKAFAAFLGVTPVTLMSWLDGTTLPKSESIELMSERLGYTVEEIEAKMLNEQARQAMGTPEVLQSIRAMAADRDGLDDFEQVYKLVFELLPRVITDLRGSQSDSLPA